MRHPNLAAGEEPRQAWVLRRCRHHLAQRGVELFVALLATVLDLQLEPAGLTEAGDRRRREHRDKAFVDGLELPVERTGDSTGGEGLPFTVFEGVEHREDHRGVRAVDEAVD